MTSLAQKDFSMTSMDYKSTDLDYKILGGGYKNWHRMGCSTKWRVTLETLRNCPYDPF